MQSIAGLIVRLERASRPDRRMDAEIMALLLGPRGSHVDPVQGLDGWDVLAPRVNGDPEVWLEAADVPAVTASVDSAAEVLQSARPGDAALILVRALRHMPEPRLGTQMAEAVERAARWILIELLRTVVAERQDASRAA